MWRVFQRFADFLISAFEGSDESEGGSSCPVFSPAALSAQQVIPGFCWQVCG
jgi:hypothetical protein